MDNKCFSMFIEHKYIGYRNVVEEGAPKRETGAASI